MRKFVEKKAGRLLLIGCILLQFGYQQPVWGGKLDDFKRDVTKKPIDQKDDDDKDDKDNCRSIFGCLLRTILSDEDEKNPDNTVKAEQSSHKKDAPSNSSFFWRKPGSDEPLLPYFRLDFSYQNVLTDINALDERLELGYGIIAAQLRLTHYSETSPSDYLRMTQFHLLSRLPLISRDEDNAFLSGLEIDAGIGGTFLDDETVGLSFTLPISCYPHKSFGMEFRPAWAVTCETDEDCNQAIADYDLGVVFRYKFGLLRGGYRWVHSDHEALDGAYFGISLTF